MAESINLFSIRVPAELIASRELLFVGGPLNGQERTVHGYLPDLLEELPVVPELLFYTHDDGTSHAYILLEDCSLDTVVQAPMYVHDRAFPAPSDASAD